MNPGNRIRQKCFVPSCTNTTVNSPNTLFVNVSKSVRKRWCKQLNIKCNESKRLMCCNDHLNVSVYKDVKCK